MTASGYSINILPKGEEYAKFETLIIKLAEQYNTPIFAPHITLLGQAAQDEDSARTLLKKLTQDQKPFKITLGKIDYQDYFFRALYVIADESPELLALYGKAKELAGKTNIPGYIPHLSLLYGDFPSEIKEKIIKEIGSEHPAVFEVNSLHLFHTEGEADDWYEVEEFPFT